MITEQRGALWLKQVWGSLEHWGGQHICIALVSSQEEEKRRKRKRKVFSFSKVGLKDQSWSICDQQGDSFQLWDSENSFILAGRKSLNLKQI